MQTDSVPGQVAAANRAAAALDERLRVLLAFADLLRVMGHEVASREMERVVMRSLRMLEAVRMQLLSLSSRTSSSTDVNAPRR
jgi:hypothetical protein